MTDQWARMQQEFTRQFPHGSKVTITLTQPELWALIQSMRIALEDGSIDAFCSESTAHKLIAKLRDLRSTK